MRPLALVLVLALSSPAHARWATAEDSPIVQESLRVDFDIRPDGTYEARSETTELVRNEEGRTHAMHYQRTFNANTTRITVEAAKTIGAGGEETPVPASFIESKPMASAGNGFDESHQLSIAYPAVSVGSRLYRKLKLQSVTPIFPGYFSYRATFGADSVERGAEYRFRSELPLFVETSDPWNRLEVTKGRDGKHFVVTIKLTGDIIAKAVDEASTWLPMEKQTWAIVSTAQTYAPIVRAVAPAYETVLAAALPPSLLKIAEEAKAQKSTVDRINLVTSRLAELVRYVGDWRAVRGTHVPHSLQEIADRRFGDCKDYSAATTAILRRLGYKAHVAWIYSGFPAYTLPKLPWDGAFNHAIVRVQDDKTVYWVDPTHPASFAQGLHDHLADRTALLIGGHDGTLENIPALTPDSSTYTRQFAIQPAPDRSIGVGARIDLHGRAAIYWTGQGLRSWPEAIRYAILRALGNGKPVSNSKIDAIDLNGRVVKDLALSGSFVMQNALMETSAGVAFPLEDETFRLIMDIAVDDRVSDLVLTAPVRQSSTYRVLGARPAGARRLGCRLESQWLDLHRRVAIDKKDTIIEDTFVVKRGVISADDMHSEPFIDFQRQMRECFYQVAIVLDQSPPKGAKKAGVRKIAKGRKPEPTLAE